MGPALLQRRKASCGGGSGGACSCGCRSRVTEELPVTTRIGTVAPGTRPEDVMRLQRLIGNRAVQRAVGTDEDEDTDAGTPSPTGDEEAAPTESDSPVSGGQGDQITSSGEGDQITGDGQPDQGAGLESTGGDTGNEATNEAAGGDTAEALQAGGSAAQSDTSGVAITTSSFAVDYKGLGDLHAKVTKKLGGSAGHVQLSGMPTMSVTGKNDSGKVTAIKVVAKGSASYPVKGSKTGTSSSDPAREATGIDNYFQIIKDHELKHASIYTDAFTKAPATVANGSLDPTEAQTAFNTVICDAFKAQDAHDTAEGCVEICCSTGNEKDATKAAGSNCGNTGTAAQSCP